MSSIKLSPNASGTGEFTIAAPNSNTNRTLTLPDQTGTVLTNAGPFTANASASAGAVTIDASNNVGIGTGSPSARLHVYGTSAETLRFQSTSSAPYQTFYNSSANRAGYIEWNTSALKIDAESGASSTIAFLTANNERARIDSSGNLLVGTTTQNGSEKFGILATGSGVFAHWKSTGTSSNPNVFRISTGQLSGGIGTGRFITCDDGGSDKFFVAGSGTVNSTSTSITAISDQRLKENVRDLETGLSEVMQLKPRRFDWKTGQGTGKKDVVGFIAQEVEVVLPDLIGEWKNQDDEIVHKSLAMGDMLPTLVKAIQELNAKVEAQAAEIAALKGA